MGKAIVTTIYSLLICDGAQHRNGGKYGIAHMAYAPLGQGKANAMYNEVIVREIAAKYSKTPAQILLRRSIQDGVTVIPKSVHAKRIAENFNVFNFELTAEEMTALRELDKATPMIGNPEKPELVEMSLQW